MAVGAAMIVWGVKTGAIAIGVDVVGTSTRIAIKGALAGGSIGAIAGQWIGSVGIVWMGGAIGIPAVLLTGGGAVVFASFGYTAGDLADLLKAVPPHDLEIGRSALVIGLALFLDGARRAGIVDWVAHNASHIRDDILILREIAPERIAQTLEEVRKMSAADTVGLGIVGMAGVGGAGIGSSLAAGTVTVLGSHALGGAALALGLVSVPVWPVIAAAAVGGIAATLVVRNVRRGRWNRLRSSQ